MKNLSDLALVAELRSLVSREREIVVEVLRFLREVEKRRLYLTRGYSSLFAFCTGELGYSESEAQLRIQAMRLMRTVPEAEACLAKGEISLSVGALIQGAAKREKLPAPETKILFRELKGVSKREAERMIATRFPESPPPERTRPISEELVEIRFTVTREQAEKIQKLLDAKAHTNFDRKYEKLFVALVEKELTRAEKVQEIRAQDTPPQCPDKVISRHIPAAIRRQIFRRDNRSCQYQDPLTHRVCGSTHAVQLDHIEPYSRGGTHSPGNLRVLCGAHNRARN